MYAQQTAETEHKDSISQENSAITNRTGLPDNMKRQYEALSGLSMDDVRVHYNSGRPSQLGALAYTQGSHVYVAPGQERHLGHELGHVIQQKQGRVRATASFDGVAVNLDDRLEQEADNYDRQARAYEAESEETHREEPNNISGIGAGASGGVTQLRPMVDRTRRWPFYVDDKYNQRDKPRFLLKLFVEMGRYVVFQIRDHVRRIFWEKDIEWVKENSGADSEIAGSLPDKDHRITSEDDYFTDRSFENKLDIEEFASLQPLDAWMEAYEEANASMAEIDESDLPEKEKIRQKNALTMYILQRHIVNALYRAEELDRMEYSGSPLSYQNRSSYMRSGAGSFVDALKELLLKQVRIPKGADVILTRSEGIRQELDKFFYYMKSENFSGEEISGQIGDVIQQIKAFTEGLPLSGEREEKRRQNKEDESFQKHLEESSLSRIFVDETDVLSSGTLEQQLSRQEEMIFRRVAQQMGLTEDGERILFLSRTGKSPDKGGRMAAVIQRLQQEEQERQSFLEQYIAALTLELNGSIHAKKKEILEESLRRARSIQETNQVNPDNISNHLATAYITYVRSKPVTDAARRLEILYRNIDYIVTAGKTITLQTDKVPQSALLLANTKMDHQAKAAVNKAGYVPSITEAIRTMLDQIGLSLPQIMSLVFTQQREKNWKKTSKGETEGRAKAMDAVEARIEQPKKLQYNSSDMESARNLARTYFTSFCQKLVDSPEMNAEKNRRIFVQASTVKKLIEACNLFENDRIPAFVWYQLDYYLDAALHSENHLVDFTRNIQAIHEIILLGIELQGEAAAPRGEEFRLDAPGAKGPGAELYQGAYLADYGLKAFAQVYDAAIAQHAADVSRKEKPLRVAAFYNIYFELTEKLNATTGANPGRVEMKAPENVEEFIAKLGNSESAEEAQNRLPDIIMIDIHPNDATKKIITQNDVAKMLGVINGYITLNDSRKKITVIVDITLNQATDDEVAGIRERAADYLADGWLNLVFVQSLTKFAQMGMDKHSGGLVFSYNKADEWKQFNDSLQESRQADPVDPYMQRYFQMLFDNASDEQREYIDIIRNNTRYVQEQLMGRLAATAITLSVNDDPGSCYVAWHYEESYAAVCELYKRYKQEENEPYSLHEFNIAILEKGINVQMSKHKLPVAMRFSFGFPISNLGETGNEVRFTIGTETSEKLDEYIELIGRIGDKVLELIDFVGAILEGDRQPQEGISPDTLFEIKRFEEYLENCKILLF
ncbi:MAG: DUF4157 domain-containing protein [Acetatifactor sp.]|nr:DUF4157 domain-containing protein [Acetatifactor sp.]